MSLPNWFLDIFSWFSKINKPFTFKGLFSIAVAAFFALYAQDSSISLLEAAVRNNYSLFLTGVSSSAFLLVFGVSEVIERGWKWGKNYYKTRKKFENLSSVQKAILKVFLDHDSGTEEFTPEPHENRIMGELNVLVKHEILQEESGPAYYSITPWAREFLKNNYDLIKGADKKKIHRVGGDYSKLREGMEVVGEEEEEEVPF